MVQLFYQLGYCMSFEFYLLCWVLEEHADDGHHGQSSVGKLCRQLLGLLFRIRRSQHLEAVVTRGAGLVVIEATAELDKAEVRSDLGPSGHWNLGNCCESIGDVGELQAGRWRQETRPQHMRAQYTQIYSDIVRYTQYAQQNRFGQIMTN